MRFSTKEQYGLRAMAELARYYGQGPVSLADVCRTEGLSLSYLEQVISPLRRAGLLESRRGAYGGYKLARQPAHITAGDVIRALEGTLVQVPCLAGHSEMPCAHEGACPTSNVWADVRRKLVETLDAMTLADLIGREASSSCLALLEEEKETQPGE